MASGRASSRRFAGAPRAISHNPAGSSTVLRIPGASRSRVLSFRSFRYREATAAWSGGQTIEATPCVQHPSYLVHDRDRVYGTDFAGRLAWLGIESIRPPIQAPRANAIGERVMATLPEKCPDHILPLRESHVRSVLVE